MNVVVVGSGLAGVTVAEGLAADPGRKVTLITIERLGYYARPRLSHGLSLSDEAFESIVAKPFAAFSPAITLVTGVQVRRIHRSARNLQLSNGKTIDYDDLVLATGSSARVPPEFESFPGAFTTLNDLDDLLALRRVLRTATANGVQPPRCAIVGGGLIGCELASDLHKAGAKICLFHRGSRLMELQFQEFQSEALAQHFAAIGVEVRLNESLTEPPAGFDATVVCTGFVARTELACAAGLDTNKGIVVDGFLRTTDPHIFAVGDVAQVDGKLFPFVVPVRSQALWLVQHLLEKTSQAWSPPAFTPTIKVHGFKVPSAPLGD